MRRRNLLSRGAAFAAFAALLWLHPVSEAAAEAVVLSSTVPDLPVGQVIAAGDAVSLPEGATVTLITQTGETVTLTGPHDGVVGPTAGDGDALSTIARLVQGQPEDLSTLGTTRGSAPEPGAAGPAAVPSEGVDVEHAGATCLQPGDAPVLSRTRTDGDMRLVFASAVAGTAAEAEVHWPVGNATAPWPDGLPLTDGAEYVASLAGLSGAQIRVVAMARGEMGEVDWITRLADVGCERQAYATLLALRDRVTPLSLYLTTDRGRRPTYGLGEELTLQVRASRDSFVYCYYQQSDGVVIPLFPMPESGGAGLAANTALVLPGPRLVGELQAAPPLGEDEVVCFGASRDVTDELPRALVPLDFTPLPDRLVAGLSDRFTALDDAEVTEARVRIAIQ